MKSRRCHLQSNFTEAFTRANPDFQNGFGYGIDPPNEVRDVPTFIK